MGSNTHTIMVTALARVSPIDASFDSSTDIVCPPEQPPEIFTLSLPVISHTTSNALMQLSIYSAMPHTPIALAMYGPSP